MYDSRISSLVVIVIIGAVVARRDYNRCRCSSQTLHEKESESESVCKRESERERERMRRQQLAVAANHHKGQKTFEYLI